MLSTLLSGKPGIGRSPQLLSRPLFLLIKNTQPISKDNTKPRTIAGVCALISLYGPISYSEDWHRVVRSRLPSSFELLLMVNYSIFTTSVLYHY
jgi:hypothetical protein